MCYGCLWLDETCKFYLSLCDMFSCKPPPLCSSDDKTQTRAHALCFADANGCVNGNGHLLNITLTMHRQLISSSDLLDKLVSLYPSKECLHKAKKKKCCHNTWNMIQANRRPILSGECRPRSDRLLCRVLLSFGCQQQHTVKFILGSQCSL